MSETDALVEQLRRANRRWKALAVVVCWALALAALAWCYVIYWRQVETNRRLAEANRALGAATESPSFYTNLGGTLSRTPRSAFI